MNTYTQLYSAKKSSDQLQDCTWGTTNMVTQKRPYAISTYGRMPMVFVTLLVTLLAFTTVTAAEDQRPNVVIIVVDDAGLTDFAPFGGEARMPTIQALADRGTKFTKYHSSPLCAPSRAMLLTGIDNHRTGVATIPEIIPAEHSGKPGYSLSLEPGVLTLADRLKAIGYQTYISGKWHLGSRPEDLPNAHGFDRSFALDASGADNWEQKSYMGFYDSAPWFEDGKPAQLPDDFYSSEFIVDRMIDYVDQGLQPKNSLQPKNTLQQSDRQPFFSYIAFQAIHIPVQAPREITDRYDGIYDQGWHALHKQRWQRAIELGLIPQGSAPAAMPETTRDWQSLNDNEKKFYARSMAVQAGMLDAMDQHIGRFVDYLEQRGELDNTLFVVTSDNGPEPSDPMAWLSSRIWMATHGYHHNIETLGEKGSMGFIGPEWASATASPSGLFKFYASEGGIRVPLIIAGPNIADTSAQEPSIITAFSMVTDITPTILDYVGLDYGDAPQANSNPAEMAITGRSLMPLINGSKRAVYASNEPIGMEVSGNSALFKGDYKITRNTPPQGDNIWHLYNLANDPGETLDLRIQEPQKFAELMLDYQAYEEEFGVQVMPADYDHNEQIFVNTLRKMIAANPLGLMLITLILTGLLAVIIYSLYWKKVLKRNLSK
jgi:arylsulfatase A-like enzyme